MDMHSYVKSTLEFISVYKVNIRYGFAYRVLHTNLIRI